MTSQRPKIFVSQAFTGKSWEALTEERQGFHKLADELGLEIVEQFIGYQGKADFENPEYNPAFILAKDKNFIKEADAFVIDLSAQSLGAACELTIAKELFDKKVYAVVPESKKRHPWVRFYCDQLFSTMEEAFKKVSIDFSGKAGRLTVDKRQYDPIAAEYRLVEETPIQKSIYDPAVEEIIKKYGQDKTVVVLHGASGYRARLAKKAGAGKVVCADISYKQTQIGRGEELREPLGIEYYVVDPYSRDFISSIPPELVGGADVVLGAFLLDHSMTPDELSLVSKNIYSILKPGGIFFGLSDHPDACAPTDPKYGVSISLDKDAAEGSPRRISIFQSVLGEAREVLHFHNFLWKQGTVEKALADVGFKSEFSVPQVSNEGVTKFGKDFWQSYYDCPTTIQIIAKK